MISRVRKRLLVLGPARKQTMENQAPVRGGAAAGRAGDGIEGTVDVEKV